MMELIQEITTLPGGIINNLYTHIISGDQFTSKRLLVIQLVWIV